MPTRPQPVATANAAAATVATLLAAVVGFGIIPAATGDSLNNALVIAIPSIVALMGVVHTVITLFTAKRTTTPVSDPKALVTQADGTTALEPLVPVSFTATESFDADPGRHSDQGAPAVTALSAIPDTPAPADPAADNAQLTFDDEPAPAPV